MLSNILFAFFKCIDDMPLETFKKGFLFALILKFFNENSNFNDFIVGNEVDVTSFFRN